MSKTDWQKDFPEMYEPKKENQIQTVDQMLRRHEKPERKVNKNPRFVAGTVQGVNKYIADRQGSTNAIFE